MAKVSGSKIILGILFNEIKKLLYFPLWWYSKGFLKVLKGSGDFIKDFEQSLGFWIWVKNLFVPMFGQKDFAGRMISIFLRLFQIIVKGIALIIMILINVLFLFVWLLLPIFIFYQIIINL